MEEKRKQIGNLIRQTRIERGLTQKATASMLNMDRGNYSAIEGGRTNLSLDRFIKIVDTLEVSHTKILSIFKTRKVIELI